ncbi:MAG: acylphosphatase [Candidatus Omnitrophica bacterium]|nr:acylphosphatase [Candidatus Omnitrophota bacterium]
MRKQVHLIISGIVQGVFFRAGTLAAARSLKLSGFVRNLSNGRVEVVAEGEEQILKRMIEWCRKGPPGARVEEMEVVWIEATGHFQHFTIR